MTGVQTCALPISFSSGISELPFGKFMLFMQPIHLGIGIVEGLATAALVMFIWKARPEIINAAFKGGTFGKVSIKKVLITFIIMIAITGGIFSWFASSHPDGLEWSIFKTSGTGELTTPAKGVHSKLSVIQKRDRKSTRLNSSHIPLSRMPSSA